jgi:hypothetical protein
METLETINPFILAPWETCMQTNNEAISGPLTAPRGLIQIAVSSSAQNGLVGYGVVIKKQPPYY